MCSAVLVFDSTTGAERGIFLAYPQAGVGVRVAAGDVDGDGIADIITSTTGLAPMISVFDMGGKLRNSFMAFDPSVASVGLTIGTADTDGDGRVEIIAGANVRGANYVFKFTGNGTQRGIAQFPMLPSSISTFGPPVAGSDIDGDGKDEVLVTVGPYVGVFGDGLSLKNAMLSYSGTGGVFVG